MKVQITLVLAVATAAAVEDASDQIVKICGDDLLKALQQACEQKSVDYLLEHGQFYADNVEKPQHRVNHDRDHNHSHNHGHDHGHNHGRDHTHTQDNHNHADNDGDRSITEECCHKPCLVKEFTSYCG